MAHLVPAGGEHPRLTLREWGPHPSEGGWGHSAPGLTRTPLAAMPPDLVCPGGQLPCVPAVPSKAWDVYINLQVLQQSSLSTPPMRPWSPSSMKTTNCTRLPRWGDSVGETWGSCRVADTQLRVARTFPLQLVYLIDNQQGRLVKRLMPWEQLLIYQQISDEYVLERQG